MLCFCFVYSLGDVSISLVPKHCRCWQLPLLLRYTLIFTETVALTPSLFWLVPRIPERAILNSFAVQWHHHSNFTWTDVATWQCDFSNSSTHSNHSFDPPYFRLSTCLCEMQCAPFTAIPMIPFVYTFADDILATNMASGQGNRKQHETCQLWFVPVLSSVKDTTWSHNSIISLELVKFTSWLARSEIIYLFTSHTLWAYSRGHSSLTSFSFWFVYMYFSWSKPFEMVLLTSLCRNYT